MKSVSLIMLMLFSFILPVNTMAGIEVNEFSSVEQEQQFKKLVDELRCLVCQNQNLSASNSELAQDLRKEVFAMIQKGMSDKEIIDFMVARYGDFVLYRPPFKPITFLLWIGPFVILLLAIFFILIFIRKNKNNEAIDLDLEEVEKITELLKKDLNKGSKE